VARASDIAHLVSLRRRRCCRSIWTQIMIGSRHTHAGFGPCWNLVPAVQLPLEAFVKRLKAATVHRHAYDDRLGNLSQCVSQPRQTGIHPQLAGVNLNK